MDWVWYAFCWVICPTPAELVGQLPNLPHCVTGPATLGFPGCLGRFDLDWDCDIDLRDWATFEAAANEESL